MGGAQPLAATMAGASMLAVECVPHNIQRRLETRYLDVQTDSLDEAINIIDQAPLGCLVMPQIYSPKLPAAQKMMCVIARIW